MKLNTGHWQVNSPDQTCLGLFSACVTWALMLYHTIKVRYSRSDGEFLKQSIRFRIHHQQLGLSSSTSDYLHHLRVPQTFNASSVHLNTHKHTQVFLTTRWRTKPCHSYFLFSFDLSGSSSSHRRSWEDKGFQPAWNQDTSLILFRRVLCWTSPQDWSFYNQDSWIFKSTIRKMNGLWIMDWCIKQHFSQIQRVDG